MATILTFKVDGDIVEKTVEQDRKPTLQEMQEMIGGYVTDVTNFVARKAFSEHYSVFVDEDGGPKQLPYNNTASMFFELYLVGTVVALIGFEKGDPFAASEEEE